MPRIIPAAPPGTTEREILEVLRDQGSGKKIYLVARFAPAIAKPLLETRLSPDQSSTTLDDDRIEIRASVADSRRLRWWLRGFGSGVEIVEPEDLRNVFRNEGRAILKRYGVGAVLKETSGILGKFATLKDLDSANYEHFE